MHPVKRWQRTKTNSWFYVKLQICKINDSMNPSFAKIQDRQTFSYVHMVILTMHNQFLLFSETANMCSVEMCYLRLFEKLKINALWILRKRHAKIMVAVPNSIPFLQNIKQLLENCRKCSYIYSVHIKKFAPPFFFLLNS